MSEEHAAAVGEAVAEAVEAAVAAEQASDLAPTLAEHTEAQVEIIEAQAGADVARTIAEGEAAAQVAAAQTEGMAQWHELDARMAALADQMLILSANQQSTQEQLTDLANRLSAMTLPPPPAEEGGPAGDQGVSDPAQAASEEAPRKPRVRWT